MPTFATKEYCTGCTACVAICPKACIEMISDENDFWYPIVDNEQCVQCGLCENTCPIVAPLEIMEHKVKAYAAYAKDEIVRASSSSGGVFTEAAKIVL